jgi:hypothetical protein
MRRLSRFVLLAAVSLVATAIRAETPEGFEPYLGFKFQFEIALPKGWSALDPKFLLSEAERAVPDPEIVVAFGALRLTQDHLLSIRDDPAATKQASEQIDPQMRWVDRGVLPGFLLQRVPAEPGMSCEGFNESAKKSLFEHLTELAMFQNKAAIREEPHFDPVAIAGCRGLRFRGKGTNSAGELQTSDVFSFSDGKTLFMFMMHDLDQYYAKNVGNFEKAMSTLKLTAAPPDPGVPGSAADKKLQKDITHLVFTEASALHEGCEPQVLKAEPYRPDEPSVVMASWDAKKRKRAEHLRKDGGAVVERWSVKSCETVDAYEVLIIPSEEGGADFVVRRLEAAK